jgi:hypothetical protein
MAAPAPIANRDAILDSIEGILRIPRENVEALFNRLSITGQRSNMSQRNDYIRGTKRGMTLIAAAPLYNCLESFREIPQVEFKGGYDRTIDYPLIIIGPPRQEINYRYITGGSYGQLYSGPANSNVMKQIVFRPYINDAKKAIKAIPEKERISNLSNLKISKFETDMPKKLGYEQNARNFFLETIIQIILANDPQDGRYFPSVQRVYIHSKSPVVRRDTRLARSEQNIAYITMEYIKYSFEKYCEHLSRTNGGIELEINHIAPIFIQLGKLLHRLKAKYNFRHADLHCNNIMIDAAGQIRMIDFGMSCLDFEGNTYKVLNDHERFLFNNEVHLNREKRYSGCDSYDLLIFIGSFIEYYKGVTGRYTFTNDAVAFLKGLLNFHYNGQIVNLYDVMKWVTENTFDPDGEPEYEAIFHTAYPDELDKINIVPAISALGFALPMPAAVGGAGAAAAAALRFTLREACRLIEALEPGRFAEIIEQHVAPPPAPAAAPAPGGIVAAAIGAPAGTASAPPHPPQHGFLRRCIGRLCGWSSRKVKNRRNRNTRRRRRYNRRN